MDHSNPGMGPTNGGFDVVWDDAEGQWNDESTAVYRPDLRRDERLAWAHGRNLDLVFERARQEGACLPTELVFSLYVQACAELAGPGRRVFVHKEDRDREPELIPARIFVQFDGEVKIDWLDPDPTRAPSERARCYLSPEQLRGLPTNGRSDLYSLTLSMAELFVLRRLSDCRGSIADSEGGPDFAELLRSGRRIPRELGALLLKSLAFDVDQRPFGVTSLLVDLERVGHRLGLQADPAITATYMRNLFFEPVAPPEAFPDPQDDRGSLRVFDALARPPPSDQPRQLLPPPLPPPPEVEPPTAGTQAPPLREAAARPPPSEVPSALARTLPPEPTIAADPRQPRRRRGDGSRPWVFLFGGGLAAVVAISFLKAGPSQVFTSVAGHWGEPLSNAVMIVDGAKKCAGARCTFELGPGVHEVSARADGYAPQLQLVAVRSSEPTAVNFRLERGGSGLEVSGQPASASVVVDGARAGRMPLEIELAPGAHRLRIEAEHFVAEERDVELVLGEIKRLDDIALVSLAEKAPEVRAPLAARTPIVRWRPPAIPRAPANAAQGNGPDALRAAMQHVIERDEAAAKAGIDIGPSGVDSSPLANEPCSVTFNTIPPSIVVVDNVRLGTTPILKSRVRPGAHVVQFIDGDTKRVKAFLCKPGEIKVIALSLNR